MTKLFLSVFFALACIGLLSAQSIVNVNTDITTNTTWTNNNVYLLTGGFIYVTNNAELTIEKGTLIQGNAASLVITRGAKIHAVGTAEEPIVFTSYQPAGSRNAGDWGGILILGKAKINDPAGERTAEGGIDPVKGLYGGTDDTDNSGELVYVRCEFAGVAYLPNSETNGMTFGGVGSGTKLEHLQVSYGGDDAFEWFGGKVNTKYLVANKTLDDCFDTDYGYSGKNQFLVALSDSNIADVSGSNGFESDNDAGGTTNLPYTNATFTNVSIFGPKINANTTFNSNFKRGGHLRRSTQIDIYNTVITGFPTGLKIEGTNTGTGAAAGDLQFKNNVLAGMGTLLDSSALTFGMASWFASNSNTSLANSTDVMATNPYNYTSPKLLLLNGSPVLTGADFSAANLQDPFFTPVTYKGAFDDKDDWTTCWTEFDPQNAVYNGAIKYISKPIITNTGATSFCPGGSVQLSAPAGYTYYYWSDGQTGQNITVNQAGNYTCSVSNARGCTATSDPITVTVLATPVASFSTSLASNVLTISNTSTNAITYTWSFGDGGTSTQQNPSYTYAAAGTYTVCLLATSDMGCIDTTCKSVQATVAIDMQQFLQNLSLIPNPTQAQSSLIWTGKDNREVKVAVMDITGKTIANYETTSKEGKNELSIEAANLSNGIYFLQIQTENALQTLKWTVMK